MGQTSAHMIETPQPSLSFGRQPRRWLRTAMRTALHLALLLAVLLSMAGPKVALAEPVAAVAGAPAPAAQPQVVPAPPPASNPTRQPRQVLAFSLQAEATATAQATLQLLWQQLDSAWNAQDWALALSLIQQIKAIDPNYMTVQDKEYYAHVNYGYDLMTRGECTMAEQHFHAALAIRPTGEEALIGLDLLSQYCATPVPTSTPGPNTLTPSPTMSITPVTPIPATVTPGGCGTISTTITYTVRPGDTLYSLANCYKTTVQAIMQANGMTTYFLRAGDTIYIPGSGVAQGGPIVHIVQPCETISSIATLYHTTVWAIMVMNGLHSTMIYAYQALFIPTALASGPIIHIVQYGETMFTIAQKYGTTVPLIMLANDFNTYDLYVFQRVVIPPAGWNGYPPLNLYMYAGPGPMPGPWAPVPGPWSPVPGPAPAPVYYTVKSGDTLYGIAVMYGTTINALRSANGLTGSLIYPGMKLRIR